MDEYGLKIFPNGWLKEFLRIQMDGLTGNMENAGEPYKSFSWMKGDENELNKIDDIWKWVPFEQTAYWFDGATKCASFLNDQKMMKRTSEIVYGVIDNADEDGYLGPKFLKNRDKICRWPHVVFFRGMIAKYYETKDMRIIESLERHFLNDKANYIFGRNVINIENILAVYNITKNEELLKMAIDIYERFQKDVNKDEDYCRKCNLESEMLSNKSPYEHGVTYNEIAKLGAILYIYTGDEKYLKPSKKAYEKILRYHMLPDGVHSSNEYFRGKNPMETHETCDIVDFSWSLGYLLKGTKDGKYADLIERCIYNGGIGTTLENFKGVQYFSGLNQVILDETSNHNFYRRGRNWMTYSPGHEVQCCSGNVNRMMPNFVSRMWMKEEDHLYSIFFGDSEVLFDGKDGEIKVVEKTNYPFEDGVEYSFSGNISSSFVFSIRVPSYCKSYKIYVNGREKELNRRKGFISLSQIKNGDKIRIEFEFEIKINEYQGGVFVERGPLLYALGMKGERKEIINKDVSNTLFPAYSIYPNKDWNFGINIQNAKPNVVYYNRKGYPWDMDNSPIGIELNVYKIPSWDLIHKNGIKTTDYENRSVWYYRKGDFTFTPPIPKDVNEISSSQRLVLYPFGMCKLRISVFPVIKDSICKGFENE